MTSSLVGSEMCIRDSMLEILEASHIPVYCHACPACLVDVGDSWHILIVSCLLYTSDAADDM
eukprot:4808219-Prorocentrum_lima.AAC.1